MTILNELIADYDNEITRLEQGREITRTRKKKENKSRTQNLMERETCKRYLYSLTISRKH